MWTRIPGAVATVALSASLAAVPGVAAGQQDSAQAAVQAWVGQWLYRAAIESAPQDQTGRITFQLDDGKLVADMDEERGARRWRIEGVRVEHNRLTGVATQTVGSMLPEGTPGTAEDYRIIEIQLKLEGDRFTGSLRARTIRGSLDGRRP
jgi:hypothetical protein